MRSWARSPAAFTCGRCAAILPAQSPVLRLFVAGVKHVKLRCPACAEEPVPADLPVKVAPPPVTLTAFDEDGIERPVVVGKPMTPIRKQAEALDWRKKASGE